MSSTQQLLLGEGAGGGIPNYIEEVFSTYTYTGNGGTQTITNGIDLATKGGFVWVKRRNATANNLLVQSDLNGLVSNTTAGLQGSGFTSFNSNGYSMNSSSNDQNASSSTYVSWTFREQPKFFDIVTYTGNGASTQTISHSLGSIPGCIIVKKTSAASVWSIYHRSLTAGNLLVFSTAADVADSFMNGANAPTSTTFTAQLATSDGLNANGATYIAYLFAHDAGGFGLAGTDNVISCGTFTTNANGNATVSLGYEPQWLMYKASSAVGNWVVLDTMRGFCATSNSSNRLSPNSSGDESTGQGGSPSATGFYGDDANMFAASNTTYIYIAIRRGPMKVPTLGTSVYQTLLNTGDSTLKNVTGAGFPPDVLISFTRILDGGYNQSLQSRLRGAGQHLQTSSTPAEVADTASLSSFLMDGVSPGTDGSRIITNTTSRTYSFSLFQRAPSFCDEVCYTGTGSATTFTHNLGVVPELMIVKSRSNIQNWVVYSSAVGNTGFLILNSAAAAVTGTPGNWNNTTPTATVFTVGSDNRTNNTSWTYVNYLFATCAGVSKVGTYTGNGTTQTINCGFTGGARFVIIKRTDASGDWYVYDTARGMTVMTDPYVLLNSSASEVATLGSVTTVATGFALDSSVLAAINVNAGTYIFLATA